MGFHDIETARDGRIFTVTINRPEKHNAVSPRTNAEMAEAFDEFANDDSLWVAILTGAGDKAFCSEGDIGVMVDSETEADYPVPASGYGGLTNRHDCFKPIIAAVNGFAFGGGFEMVLAADLAIAAEGTKFGLPEPKIGTAAVAGGMHRLVRQLGWKPAMKSCLPATRSTLRRRCLLVSSTASFPIGSAHRSAQACRQDSGVRTSRDPGDEAVGNAWASASRHRGCDAGSDRWRVRYPGSHVQKE